MKTANVILILIAVVGISLIRLPDGSKAQDKKGTDGQAESQPMNLSDFMRVKLHASDQILEGLAMENMDLVKEGAQTLNKMSLAEKWRKYNDATYRQFSDEFQRNTQELLKSAREDNLDQAALKWFAVTMNCIECHRFVRNNLVAQSGR